MKFLKEMDRRTKYKFLFMFVLVYISEDVLIFATNRNRLLFWVKLAVLASATVALLVWDFYKGCSYRSSGILPTALMCLNVVVTLGLLTELDNRHVYTLMLLVLSLIIVHKLTEEEFVEFFSNIMVFLAIFSLIQYVIFLIAYPVAKLAPTVTNINGYRFSNWLFSVSMFKEDYDIMPYRNWGIYREPGVYVIFLALALIFELFFREKPRLFRVLILLLTTFTTFSTAGYIIAIIIMVLHTLQIKASIWKKVAGLVGLVVAAVLLSLILELCNVPIYHWVFEKLKREGGSAGSRVGSILSNLMLFARSPLIGNGWVGMAENSATIQSVVKAGHNTNTLLIYYSVYGILFGSTMLFGSMRFFLLRKRGVVGVLLAIVWVIALSNANLTLNITVYLIAFYGFVKEKENLLPRSKEACSESY